MADWDEFPVHLMDGCKLNHKVLGWTMRFNDVLDANLLHSSLTRLLSIGDWRKLGGRLKRNVSSASPRHPTPVNANEDQKNGQLKIYVPKEFTPSIPAVEYTHDASHHLQSITTHPIGRQFITPTVEPSIQPLDKHLRQFMAPDDYPESVDALLQTDKSQISLMITSFNDATLVSVAFPHTLLDAVSFIHLVQNWSLVLAGRESDVPPLLDAHTDALEGVCDDARGGDVGDCRMESMRLKGFGFWKLLVRQMAEATQRKRRLQALYIPKETYEKLLSKLEYNSESNQQTTTGKPPNEVDILTAWLIRTIAQQEPSRPVTLITLYNLRYYIKSLKEARKRGIFSQIMISTTCAIFPPETSTKCVSEIAKDYKEQVGKLTQEEEVVAYLSQVRDELKKEKPGFALYGATDALVVFCNPLAKLDLVKMADFGSAVVRRGGDGSTPAGRMVGNVFNPLSWTDAGVDLLFPLGTDYEGGCWIMAKLGMGSWEILTKELGGW